MYTRVTVWHSHTLTKDIVSSCQRMSWSGDWFAEVWAEHIITSICDTVADRLMISVAIVVFSSRQLSSSQSSHNDQSRSGAPVIPPFYKISCIFTGISQKDGKRASTFQDYWFKCATLACGKKVEKISHQKEKNNCEYVKSNKIR